ncbi:MAG: DUF2075 domain-containing protein [Chitinophagia bacterium]
MSNYYYQSSIEKFLASSNEEIIGAITIANQFDSNQNQNKSWELQIPFLKTALTGYTGHLYFEFSIPRMGKRVDAIVIIDSVVFIIEFKVGETKYQSYQIEQVWDYALDLKNFHKPSHEAFLAPILVATEARNSIINISTGNHQDKLLYPVLCNSNDLKKAIDSCLQFANDGEQILSDQYSKGSYAPTPTIIEAAVSLYANHSVDAITRSDADAKNLSITTHAISDIIEDAKLNKKKCICFVTGVPGAGKTLVGLDIATSHLDKDKGDSSVYLSGNGPLVAILQEALARDHVRREKSMNRKKTLGSARDGVKAFIQIIHHYRDAYLNDLSAPFDHVAIFDEAQRAWNKQQTVNFMRRKKNKPDFNYSEPEYLISCLDRHEDWAVVVCLVGGGQEINTGEAGIAEWLTAIEHLYKHWEVYISPNLTDSEYAAETAIKELSKTTTVNFNEDLHLSVSMRSFRAEKLSLFIKQLLDREIINAQETLKTISSKYPIVLTRDLQKAKKWLKGKARGSERYGMVVSSQAYRLKPLAIDVKTPTNPVNWFLSERDDVRSSYYLEDVATEFQIQGLELDWVCVTWDGDFRYAEDGWKSFSFVGTKWQNINKLERKQYLINAYRVLLTRARQGMVIVVPEGDIDDHTRKPEFYNSTYNYLKLIGIEEI